MSVPDWSELTTDQQFMLLSAPNLKVTSGLELLESNFNLLPEEDLTEYLIPGGGNVRWDGSATVHRTCSFALRTNLQWNRDLVRVYRVYSDDKSGVTCRGNKGVFIASAANQDLASSPTIWQVTGQDRMAWLNQPISQSLSFAKNTLVFAALNQVFAMSAGKANIDPFQKTALIPATMTYSLPTGGDAVSSATLVLPNLPGSGQQDTSGAPTWLQVITDLLALINYQGVWCDSEGVFQCLPNLPFVNRDATFTFDAAVPNLVAQARSITRTPPTFNTWRFLNSTLPDTTSDGTTTGTPVPATPTVGNGIALRVNRDNGPSSVQSMFGMTFATTVSLAAGTQEVLEALADAYVATAIRSVESASVATRAFPGASHFDVFRWVDSSVPDSPWIAAATTWTEPLDGGSTQWTWTKVADG